MEALMQSFKLGIQVTWNTAGIVYMSIDLWILYVYKNIYIYFSKLYIHIYSLKMFSNFTAGSCGLV